MEQIGTFLGRYQLVRVLGRGAMGVVYEGLDPKLNRQVAVKTILKSQMQEQHVAADYSARFIREAQAVARLNHPNIVTVFDFGNEAEIAYLVMEFIRGKELKNYLDDKHVFSIAEAVAIVCDLLEALDYAHNHGIIHRDIKPANVMLDGSGRVKLTDFGVARQSEGAGNEGTRAGTMVGTPSYMSPEQIQGLPAGAQADLFATGVLLYQCLSLQKPFVGNSEWEIWQKIVNLDPPPLSNYRAAVPPALERAMLKALAKDPKNRPATARALIVELKAALADGPMEVAPFDADATLIVGLGGLGGPAQAGSGGGIEATGVASQAPAARDESVIALIAHNSGPGALPQGLVNQAAPVIAGQVQMSGAVSAASAASAAPKSKTPLLLGSGLIALALIGGAVLVLSKPAVSVAPAQALVPQPPAKPAETIVAMPAPASPALPATAAPVPTPDAIVAAGPALEVPKTPKADLLANKKLNEELRALDNAKNDAKQLVTLKTNDKASKELAEQKVRDEAIAEQKNKDDAAALKGRESADQKARDDAKAKELADVKAREDARIKELAAQKAKPKADPDALFASAQRSEKEGRAREAVELYKQAYGAGNGRAARILGDIYGRGNADIGRDYGEQVQWYEKAKAMGVDVPAPEKHKY